MPTTSPLSGAEATVAISSTAAAAYAAIPGRVGVSRSLPDSLAAAAIVAAVAAAAAAKLARIRSSRDSSCSSPMSV